MSAKEIKSLRQRAIEAAMKDGCSLEIAQTVADFAEQRARLAEAEQRTIKVNVEEWRRQHWWQIKRNEDRTFYTGPMVEALRRVGR